MLFARIVFTPKERKLRKTRVLPIAAAFDQGLEKFKQTIREAVEAAAAT